MPVGFGNYRGMEWPIQHAENRQMSRQAVAQRAAVIASGGAFTVGLLALLGWTTGSDALRSILPGAVAMNPTTALAGERVSSPHWRC